MVQIRGRCVADDRISEGHKLWVGTAILSSCHRGAAMHNQKRLDDTRSGHTHLAAETKKKRVPCIPVAERAALLKSVASKMGNACVPDLTMKFSGRTPPHTTPARCSACTTEAALTTQALFSVKDRLVVRTFRLDVKRVYTKTCSSRARWCSPGMYRTVLRPRRTRSSDTKNTFVLQDNLRPNMMSTLRESRRMAVDATLAAFEQVRDTQANQALAVEA